MVMTIEEAEKITIFLLEADSGCIVCAKSLCDDFKKAFPEFTSLIEKIWSERYEQEY